MIVVKVTGGLGNQLFQYAFGRQLAIRNNVKLKLDLSSYMHSNFRDYGLSNFHIDAEAAEVWELPFRKRTSKNLRLWWINLIKDKIFSSMEVQKEKHFHFDSTALKFLDNTYVEGYWQSEKYFKDIEDILKGELRFKSPLDSKNSDISKVIENTNSVALHIRRGDYLSTTNKTIYAQCPIEYYINSINEIAKSVENPYFFVFSDDIEWAISNLKINYSYQCIKGNEAWVDMKLMSLCKHNIIANSTFSWWGAYLGEYKEKVVIAPSKWFVDSCKLNSNDLVPKLWTKL